MTNAQNSRNAPRSGKFIEIWLRTGNRFPFRNWLRIVTKWDKVRSESSNSVNSTKTIRIKRQLGIITAELRLVMVHQALDIIKGVYK